MGDSIKETFIVTEHALGVLEKKALDGMGFLRFWKLRYYLAGVFLITIFWFMERMGGRTAFFLIPILLLDYIAYRKERRMRLKKEVGIVRRFVQNQSNLQYYRGDGFEEAQRALLENESIRFFGKRKISRVNPIHYLRKRVMGRETARRLPHGDRLLDIGCHFGHITEELKPKCRKIVGMDLQLYSFPEFRKRTSGFPVIGNAEYQPFKDECFDIVSFTEIVEHLTNPFSALENIHRVLGRDGKMILTTENRSVLLWEHFLNPIKFLERVAGVYFDRVLRVREILWRGESEEQCFYHTAFSRRELDEMMGACDLKIEYMTTFSHIGNLHRLFSMMGMDMTEAAFCRIQLGIDGIFGRLPALKYTGSNWLIIAGKAH